MQESRFLCVRKPEKLGEAGDHLYLARLHAFSFPPQQSSTQVYETLSCRSTMLYFCTCLLSGRRKLALNCPKVVALTLTQQYNCTRPLDRAASSVQSFAGIKVIRWCKTYFLFLNTYKWLNMNSAWRLKGALFT